MNVVKLNGIKVYNLTANRSLPEWASKNDRKKKRLNEASGKHIELIQELEMPDSTTYITCSPDQRYLFTLGRYKPRVRCYELGNLAMKFDRCVDYLPLKICCLSDDYSKFVLLEEDRWIDVHAAGGHYFRFRVPKPGVDMCYCPSTCDLYIASSSSSLYRMNLSEGRFNTSLSSARLEGTSFGFTSLAYGKEYGILLGASTMGCVDGWDVRCSERVFGLDVRSSAPLPEDLQDMTSPDRRSLSITHMTLKDPLNVAVGTSEGMVYIYDLRQNRKPWHSRDTEFREPVKSISFHDDKVLALLPRCLKTWYIENGNIFVGFDTGPVECNWMYHFQKSGLIMLATESPKISTYFIPFLGEAPSWCSHLDQLVMECEPDESNMYDGYKFVTRQQLAELGMSELIGTQFLRAYMHGYFISSRLYNKVQERLGISMKKNPVPIKTYTNEPIKSDRNDMIVEEFNEASTDQRFSKLGSNPKLVVSLTEKESDLIQIHQSRLEKKRRRKQVRRDHASRSEALVKEKTNLD